MLLVPVVRVFFCAIVCFSVPLVAVLLVADPRSKTTVCLPKPRILYWVLLRCSVFLVVPMLLVPVVRAFFCAVVCFSVPLIAVLLVADPRSKTTVCLPKPTILYWVLRCSFFLVVPMLASPFVCAFFCDVVCLSVALVAALVLADPRFKPAVCSPEPTVCLSVALAAVLVVADSRSKTTVCLPESKGLYWVVGFSVLLAIPVLLTPLLCALFCAAVCCSGTWATVLAVADPRPNTSVCSPEPTILYCVVWCLSPAPNIDCRVNNWFSLGIHNVRDWIGCGKFWSYRSIYPRRNATRVWNELLVWPHSHLVSKTQFCLD